MSKQMNIQFRTSFVVLRPPELDAYAVAVDNLRKTLNADPDLDYVAVDWDRLTHQVTVAFTVTAPSFADANVKSMRSLLEAIHMASITTDRINEQELSRASTLHALDKVADEYLTDRCRQLLLA